MTIVNDLGHAAASATRSDLDLLHDQLRAVESWVADHRLAPEAAGAVMSRQARVDFSRRQEVLTRTRQALIDWTAHQLGQSGHPLRSSAQARVVVAHRNEWFKDKLVTALRDRGMNVVAVLEDGASAVGVSVVEQPDLVLLEDKLTFVPGLEVIRQLRRYAPTSFVAAQVEHDGEVALFLRVGAGAAYPRRIPAGELAASLCQVPLRGMPTCPVG